MTTVNQNKIKCIIEQTTFTETVVHNICSGDVKIVPHGGVDFLVGSLCISILILFLLTGLKTLFCNY